MNIELIKQLNEIGLTHKEAILYEGVLSSGPTTILLISKSSGLKRSTIYNTIETLIEKGLIHYEVKGKKKLIAADSPEQINTLLARQKLQFDSILPNLQALYRTASTPGNQIKEFHGLMGIRSVYSQLLIGLQKNDDYLVISDQDKWYQLDPVFFEDFIRKRAKLSLNIRLLLQDTPHAREFQKKQKNYNEIIKCLPARINLNINMVITSLTTIIVQLTPPVFALVIENKNLVTMNRLLFDLIWDIC